MKVPASSNKFQKKKKKLDSDDAVKLNKSSKKPFKLKKKDQNDATRSQAVALQLGDDEPAFPRGSGLCFLGK